MPTEKLKNKLIRIDSEINSLEKKIKLAGNISFNLDHLQSLYLEISTLFSKITANTSDLKNKEVKPFDKKQFFHIIPYALNNLIFLSGSGLICPDEQKQKIHQALQIIQPLYNKIQNFIALQQKLVNEIKLKLPQEKVSDFETSLKLLKYPLTGSEVKNIVHGKNDAEFIRNRLTAIDKFPLTEMELYENLSHVLNLLQPIVKEWELHLDSLKRKGQTGGTRQNEIVRLRDGICMLLRPHFVILENKFNLEQCSELFLEIQRTFEILKNNPERFLNGKDIIEELENESVKFSVIKITEKVTDLIYFFTEKIYDYSSRFYNQKEIYQKKILEYQEISSELNSKLAMHKQNETLKTAKIKKEKLFQRKNNDFISQTPYLGQGATDSNIFQQELPENIGETEINNSFLNQTGKNELFTEPLQSDPVTDTTKNPVKEPVTENYFIEVIEGLDSHFVHTSNLDHKTLVISALNSQDIKNPLFSMSQLDYQKLIFNLSDDYRYLMSDRKNPVTSQTKFRTLSESDEEEMLKIWWEAFGMPEAWIRAYQDETMNPVKRGVPFYFFKLPNSHPNRKPNDYEDFKNGPSESGIIARFGEWKNREGFWMPVIYVTSMDNKAVSTPHLLKDFLERMVLSSKLAGAILRNDTIINTYREENFVFETGKKINGFFNKNKEYIPEATIKEISKNQQGEVNIKIAYFNNKTEVYKVKELYISIYNPVGNAFIGVSELATNDSLYYLPESKTVHIKRLFKNLQDNIIAEISDEQKVLFVDTKEIFHNIRRIVKQIQIKEKLVVENEKFLLRGEEVIILKILKGLKREQKPELLLNKPIVIDGKARTLITTEEFNESLFAEKEQLKLSINIANFAQAKNIKKLPDNLLAIDQDYTSFSKPYKSAKEELVIKATPAGDIVSPLGKISHYSRGHKDWAYLYSGFDKNKKQPVLHYVLIDGNNPVFSEACGKVAKNALATDTTERILRLALHEKIDAAGLAAETLNASLIGLHIIDELLNDDVIIDIFHAGNICCFSTDNNGIKEQIPLEQNANGATNRISLISSNNRNSNNIFSIKENINRTSVSLKKGDKLFVISNGLELDLETNTNIIRIPGIFWPFTIEQLASHLTKVNAVTARKILEYFHLTNMFFTEMIRERSGEGKTRYIQYSVRDYTEEEVKRKYETYLDNTLFSQSVLMPFFLNLLKLLKSENVRKLIDKEKVSKEAEKTFTVLSIIKIIYDIKNNFKTSEISEEINEFHSFVEDIIEKHGKKYLQEQLKSLHKLNKAVINLEPDIISPLYNIIVHTQSPDCLEKRNRLISSLSVSVKRNNDISQLIKRYLDTRINEAFSIFVFECERTNAANMIIYDKNDQEAVETDRLEGRISANEIHSPEVEIMARLEAKYANKKNIYDLTKTMFYQ